MRGKVPELGSSSNGEVVPVPNLAAAGLKWAENGNCGGFHDYNNVTNLRIHLIWTFIRDLQCSRFNTANLVWECVHELGQVHPRYGVDEAKRAMTENINDLDFQQVYVYIEAECVNELSRIGLLCAMSKVASFSLTMHTCSSV